MSARSSMAAVSPRACSGAMYAGVPRMAPTIVRSLGDTGLCDTRPSSPSKGPWAASRSLRARPQSMSITSPKRPTITLAGFKSRWMTPWAWAYCTARRMA